MSTPEPTIIVFNTDKELKALTKLKAITFCRSSKTAILRMIESYDELMRECSDLKTEQHKSRQPIAK